MNHWRFSHLHCLLSLGMVILMALSGMVAAAAEGSERVYFGTYTGRKSKGIYCSRFNSETGELSKPELVAETPSPSFLVAHPKDPYLYAVNELNEMNGQKSGGVSAFQMDKDSGRLTLLNQQSSGGSGPCHLILDEPGRNLLVANYGGGSVSSFPVQKSGALSPATAFVQHRGSSVNKSRQEAPHAHGIYLDPSDRFAYVPDLGLDQVLIYRFDARKGSLTAASPAFAAVTPGSGPRHFSVHPKGRFAYLINELVCTVTAFSRDARRGELKEIQTISTLPPDVAMKPEYSTAELLMHPSGKFLYGSNRGHDTVVVYSVHPRSGMLTWIENVSTGGKIPRSFGLHPSGRWLLAANQNSDSVVVFQLDPKTGRLRSTGTSVEVGSPVSVAFVP